MLPLVDSIAGDPISEEPVVVPECRPVPGLFNPDASETFSLSDLERSIVYSQNTVGGFIAYDHWATTSQQELKANAFEFLAVLVDRAPVVDGKPIQGLLGLSTSRETAGDDIATKLIKAETVGPLFIDFLFDQEQIEKK
jgi:hypothetical protein